MTNVAILGFGVVGGGVADLLENNDLLVKKLAGEVNLKYILDLRDFPDSPHKDKVIHDFSLILDDPEIDVVIETMGGEHPAYEYTIEALRAGKSVITSNKEVVSKHGDEFLMVAEANSVAYRFEAAVGGGIPIISPIIELIRHNVICEVRGILNGTTNYILTKMFSYGESFEDSLKDAQEKGYAERNPDADVLGLDAARKISILGALATENLVNTEKIHVEGITEIRSQDVKAAEKAGMSIKLLGRAIFDGMKITMMVAPFMLSRELPLSCVNGVYNAVEVIGEPIGNLMFYGQGAGAGATASAIVSDLIQTISHGMSALQPSFVKNDSFLTDFGDFECRHYVSAEGADEEKLSEIFGEIQVISDEGEIAFITEAMKEKDVNEKIALSGAKITSRIRLL